MKLTVVVTLKNLAVCWKLRMNLGTRRSLAVTNRWGRTISRKDSKKTFENPQRLYARPREGMRQSDLHGNVQSAAEMTAPASRKGSEVTRPNGPKVAKFLVG